MKYNEKPCCHYFHDYFISIQALDGFLFIVNSEGRVEHVSDNITEYINYKKSDVLKKSIYNIIHHGDHNNFIPNILPMSVGKSQSQSFFLNNFFTCTTYKYEIEGRQTGQQ